MAVAAVAMAARSFSTTPRLVVSVPIEVVCPLTVVVKVPRVVVCPLTVVVRAEICPAWVNRSAFTSARLPSRPRTVVSRVAKAA